MVNSDNVMQTFGTLRLVRDELEYQFEEMQFIDGRFLVYIFRE